MTQPQKKNTLERVNEIIAAKCEIDIEKIKPAARLREDLCVDSLDAYESLYQIEEEFGMTISDEELVSWSTVRDVYNTVLSKTGEHTYYEKGKILSKVEELISKHYHASKRRLKGNPNVAAWLPGSGIKMNLLNNATVMFKTEFRDIPPSKLNHKKDFYKAILCKVYMEKKIYSI